MRMNVQLLIVETITNSYHMNILVYTLYSCCHLIRSNCINICLFKSLTCTQRTVTPAGPLGTNCPATVTTRAAGIKVVSYNILSLTHYTRNCIGLWNSLQHCKSPHLRRIHLLYGRLNGMHGHRCNRRIKSAVSTWALNLANRNVK